MFDASRGVASSPSTPGQRPAPSGEHPEGCSCPTDDEIALMRELAAADLAQLRAEYPGGLEPWDLHDAATAGSGRAPDGWSIGSIPPGPALAFELEDADEDDADDYNAVEIVAAWHRLLAWAQLGVVRAAASLARRPSMVLEAPDAPGEGLRGPRPGSAAAHEIAMRLVTSRSQAQTMIDIGEAVTGPLARVGAALRAGDIDLPRAKVFVEGLAASPEPVMVAVQDAVLPDAGRRSVRQVREDVARALIGVDPAEASRRHRVAREGRHVGRPRALADGMAGIWSVLPAPDAVALDTALEAAARAARAEGDERSVGQLRADILAGVGHAALATGWIGGPGGDGGDSGSRPASGAAAASGDGDHREEGSSRLGRIGGRKAQIRVTVPLSVLLGQDAPPDGAAATSPTADGPADGGTARGPTNGGGAMAVAELDGYGPVPPDVARALALGGTWKRLVVDPVSGLVRDIGRARYQPPAELAELVRTRDRTCIRPGCGASAQGCELDHTIPFHLGGHTAEWNLGVLCPADHAFKTLGGVAVRQVEPGVFEFGTRTGHAYRRDAGGSTYRLPRRSPPP